MADIPEKVAQPATFNQVDSLTHNGVVVAFGEEWSTDGPKLWYRVLDLEQTADADLETSWEDATRWTRWYEIAWPPGLRSVGMSLFDLPTVVDHSYATIAGRWKVIDDGEHVVLFRALDLTPKDLAPQDPAPTNPAPADEPPLATRVYANRFRLERVSNGDELPNGKELFVPQLMPVAEARYRRGERRESAFGDTDSQGTRDLANNVFAEPTMEWSMLRPLDGAFTVTLTPSDIPGRLRWQFLCNAVRETDSGATEPAIAAYSFLRDEDGWADLAEKFDQLNSSADDRFQILPDTVFAVTHETHGTLAMHGRPASASFRMQEQNSSLAPANDADDDKDESRAVSGQRVMVAMRVAVPGTDQASQLVAIDFPLNATGAIEVDGDVAIGDVDFGRRALWFNSPDDRAGLSTDAPQQAHFTVGAWLTHTTGSGTIISRGFDPGDDHGADTDQALTDEGADSTAPDGWSLEWQAYRRKIVGVRVVGGKAYRVEAAAPGSRTWHHVALTHDAAALTLTIDGAEAATRPLAAPANANVDGKVIVGGPLGGQTNNAGWVDFTIDEVVLNQTPVLPTVDTIFLQLDAAAQSATNVLGYWDFDAPSDAVDIVGADRVSQTAPLFPPSKENFEQTIGQMSVGMGLVSVPDWLIASDPNLFVGSDGIVRTYVAARPDDPDETESIAAELVYDTTTTRARFGIGWAALPTGQAAPATPPTPPTNPPTDPEPSAVAVPVQRGELLLQAREPGPIMNRAIVEVEQDQSHLTLRIRHPKRVAGAVSDVLEEWKQLPTNLEDFAAVINGSAPSLTAGNRQRNDDSPFAYDYTKGPQAQSTPYRSAIVQAIVTGVPDNGAVPAVQPGLATLRQVGNFTGWTRAPLAVAADLSDRVATIKIGDDLNDLRIPGDFSVEAWINPNEAEGGTEQRVLNWRQSETDTFSLSIKSQKRFALSSDSSETSRLELPSRKQNWFTNAGGFKIGATFALPDGGDAGNFRTLLSHACHWSVTLTPDQFGALAKTRPATPPADVDQWLARFDDSSADVTFEVHQTISLGVRGRSLVLLVDQTMPGASANLELVRDLVARQFDAVRVPLDVSRGDLVNAEVVLNDSAPADGIAVRPTALCTINGTAITDAATQPMADDPGMWFVPPASPDQPRLELGHADTPFVGPITKVHAGVGNSFSQTFSEEWRRDDEKGRAKFFNGTLDFFPTLGNRQFETIRGFAPANWLHIAAVCSDNFAVRFDGEGQRAVISDASGLTPEKEFTIDCVVVRESLLGGTILSKAIELDAEKKLTLRLSIDILGRPVIEYAVVAEGTAERHRHVGPIMAPGKPYHVIATVKLEDVTYPPQQPEPNDEKPPPQWQLWVAHNDIWVYDIEAATWLAGAPRDLTLNLRRLGSIDWTAIHLNAMAQIPRPLPEDWTNRLAAAAGIDRATTTLLDVNTNMKKVFDMRLQPTSGPAVIGAATGEDPNKLSEFNMQWFGGLIGFVRVWNSALPGAAARQLPLESGLPEGVAKPIAWWKLDENRGLQADDVAGSMPAILTAEEMWVTTRETARLRLYLNGRERQLRPIPASRQTSTIDHGDHAQFTIGGAANSGESATSVPQFHGLVDDVRLWNDVRSGEEVLDLQHSRLGGNEDDLAAWWPINAGAGTRIKDCSKRAANHLEVSGDANLWQRDNCAPVGDDLPQVRHLLGGAASDRTLTNVQAAPMAAEYGEVQTDADGRVTGSQKRALVVALADGDKQETGPKSGSGWATPTQFKIGDIDLLYIGQAQSDPTLIGYIEGAPPIPSENLTRPYWKSPYSYDAYNDRTQLTLREAENTTVTYKADYETGFNMSIAAQLLLVIESLIDVGTGVAFGGFVQSKVKAADVSAQIGVATAADLTLANQQSFETSTGTHRTAGNTIGLAGSWEQANEIKYPALGRRLIPDNTGYALVKSGVANVYAMRLRRNGAMLGLTMQPDPDIPEDFNVITFKLRSDYTKQGTIDGNIGMSPDWESPNGSYYRPHEAANLEAQIEVDEAKLLAAHESFNARDLGRGHEGYRPARNNETNQPKKWIERAAPAPFDWESNLNKRNLVNTYVWTAAGGLFAEETSTSVTRTESSGGSYSYKAMFGVKSNGKIALGLGVVAGATWDISAMFGLHIKKSVVKTKNEGRNFGLDVKVDCDALLERYTGQPDQLYSGQPEPGKVSSYRFKSFYLVPQKSHFEDFWSRVVDLDWLEGDDLDAVALRQAKQNNNQVWRVLHRVTYVQRVPPNGTTVPAPAAPPGKAVVHTGPNWQVINLALDVLRQGHTSTGTDITQLSPNEQLAAAADDLVRNQWPVLAPRWQASVTSFDNDEPGAAAESVATLRRLTYEYLQAYADTGLLDENRRLTTGPTPALPPGTEPPPEPEPELPPLDRLAEGAANALHLYTFDRVHAANDQKANDYLEFTSPARIAHDELPTGLGGRLVLPGGRRTRANAAATIGMSGDWGRTANRTYELCFRLTSQGAVLVASVDHRLAPAQQPFKWIAIDNERRDGNLAIWPGEADESVSLPGVTTQSVGKLVYLAVGYAHPTEQAGTAQPPESPMLDIAWASEDRPDVQRLQLPTSVGDQAGGQLTLGGTGIKHFGYQFATGSLEVLHLAVHDQIFEPQDVARRLRSIGIG